MPNEKIEQLVIEWTGDLVSVLSSKYGVSIRRKFITESHWVTADSALLRNVRAEAPLEEKSLRFNKHGGVHGAFGEHYVKSGLFNAKIHRWRLNAFDQRIEGDYDTEVIAVTEDARRLIAQSEEFLAATRSYLESLP
jgi:hypothetical protein